MKKCLLAAFLFITTIHAEADILAYTSNANGGRIELMTTSVPDSFSNIPGCADAHIAKSWDGRQGDIYGCWTVLDDTITVNWVSAIGDDTNRTYPVSAFTLAHPYKSKKKPSM